MPFERHSRRAACAVASITALTALAAAAPAGAASPSVQIAVVGKTGTIIAPRTVSAGSFSTTIGTGSKRKTCSVAAGTPLAALKSIGMTVGIKDFGSCSRNAADSASLYIDSIRGVAGTGMEGWSYKVDNRAGTAGAADPAGPFGGGLLKSGAKVLWFWCVYDPTTYACQRNLVIVAPASAKVGVPFTVSVRAYDDSGAWVAAAGANVTAGTLGTVLTGTAGTARFTATEAGSVKVSAVDSMPVSSAPRRPDAFGVSVKVT